MSYTAVQDTPIIVDLVAQARTTGWSINGTTAIHESCNSGNIRVNGYSITAGHTYTFTYQVLSISGGIVRPSLGGVNGVSVNSTGLKSDTITATTNGGFYFYSDANCEIEAFTISDVTESTDPLPTNTIAYSAKLQKWTSFYTFIPDCGTAIFNRCLVFDDGDMYIQLNATDNRSNFFGTQYDSVITFVENNTPTLPKSYLSLSIQANELMVTGEDGITTSLGQVSELAAVDFNKSFMSFGSTSYNANTLEGIYSAGFLRDKNTDLLNGDPLKGTYLIMTLMSTSNVPLVLYTVNIVSKHSAIGAR